MLEVEFDKENFSGHDYVRLGYLYEELKDYSHAMEAYNKIITSASKDDSNDLVIAYDYRANLYIQLNEYDKAIADCDKGLELTTDNFWISQLNQSKEKAIELKKIEGKDKIDLNDANALIQRAEGYFLKHKLHE